MQIDDFIKEYRETNPFVQNTELAYRLLLECIICGDLKPGDKILQDVYANKFNMSRTPVRDALLKLQDEGYICGNGQKNFTVNQIYYSDYAELSKFRSMMEEYAIRYAVKNFEETNFRAMSRNIRQMQELNKEQDTRATREKLMELDFAFHQMIVDEASNKYLIHAYNELLPRYRFYQSIVRRERYNLIYVVQTHKQIYNAIYERDEDRAVKLMHEHCGFYETSKIQELFERTQLIR